jgi:hypothetical protein
MLRGWLDIAFTCQGFKGVEITLSHLSPAFSHQNESDTKLSPPQIP